MYRKLLFLSACLLVACGDNGGGDAVDGGGADAPAVTTVLFLNFDGATLTKGTPDDPANNISLFIRPPSGTVPPWRDGMPGRDASIAAITAGVRSVLAPYDIDVVTQRPAAAPYHMVMFGGQARDLFGAGPVDFMGGGDCHPNPDVSYVTETVLDDEVAANFAVYTLGSSQHIPDTTLRGDCLCSDIGECRPYTNELCTIGGAGTPVRDSGLDVGFCGMPPPPPTIDEHALFLAAFGPHG